MTEWTSKHFKLEKVGQGVYAAIAKEGGGAIGNAGFIDLGGETIIFDTFNTQQAAEELRHVAEAVTNQPVSWVINSHWHGDHIRGNQAFQDCQILASQTTLDQMKENHPQRIAKQKEDLSGLTDYIDSLINQSKSMTDKKLENQISFLKEIEKSLPDLELVLPKFAFNTEFTIYGTKRTAVLIAPGGGHSVCDSILYLPEDEIIFMADLLFVEMHPSFFPESSPTNWESILNQLESFKIQKAIPGHGPVGTKQDLTKLKDYIKELIKISNGALDVNEIPIPEPYKEWASPDVFKQSIKLLRES